MKNLQMFLSMAFLLSSTAFANSESNIEMKRLLTNKADALLENLNKTISPERKDGDEAIPHTASQVQAYINNKNNALDYKKINENLNLFGKQMSSKSNYLKNTQINADSNIADKDNTNFYGVLNAKFMLKFYSDIETNKLKSDFNVKSIALNLGAERGLGVKSIYTIALVDTFLLDLKLEMTSLEIMKSVLGVSSLLKNCKSDEATKIVKRNPDLKEVFNLSCFIAKTFNESNDFTNALRDTEGPLNVLNDLIEDAVDAIVKNDTHAAVAFITGSLYELKIKAEMCDQTVFTVIIDKLFSKCTPHFKIDFEGEAFLGEGELSLIVEEAATQGKLKLNVSERALSFTSIDKDETMAEILTGYYIYMKVVESLTPAEITFLSNLLVKDLDKMVKQFDEALLELQKKKLSNYKNVPLT